MMVQWIKIMGIVGLVLGCNKVAAVDADTDSGTSSDTPMYDMGTETSLLERLETGTYSDSQSLQMDSESASDTVSAVSATDDATDMETESSGGTETISLLPVGDSETATYPDTATSIVDMETDSDTETHVATVISLDDVSFTYEYIQTNLVLASGIHGPVRDLRLSETGDGDIVATGTTTDPVLLGMPPEQRISDTDVTYFFVLVYQSTGNVRYRWFYPDMVNPLAISVTDDGKLLWVADYSGRGDGLNVGGKTLTHDAAQGGFIHGRVDLHGGDAEVLTAIPPGAVSEDQQISKLETMTGDDAGNVYLGGSAINKIGNLHEKAFIAKFDASGQLLWYDSFVSCESSAYVNDLTMISAQEVGGVGTYNCSIVIGEDEWRTDDRSGDRWRSDGFAVLANAETGDPVRSLQMGGNEPDYLMTVDGAPDGNIYLGGIVGDAARLANWDIPEVSHPATVAVKMSASGQVIWIIELTDTIWLDGSGVDTLGRLHIVGSSGTDGSTGNTSSVLALSEDGSPLAQISFVTNQIDNSQVAFDGENGIWVAGAFFSNLITPDGTTAETDGGGNYLIRFELVPKSDPGN